MAMLRTVALVSSLVLAVSLVNAEEEKEKPGAENEKERIDTEHLFGFMLGTDIGEVGEKEIQPVYLSRFEKHPGYYRVFSPRLNTNLCRSRTCACRPASVSRTTTFPVFRAWTIEPSGWGKAPRSMRATGLSTVTGFGFCN
jgi:hypothetical protein